MRLDFIDYPTGWELQDQVGIDSPPHHPKCSAVTQRGALLCDCDAIILKWVELGGDPDRYELKGTARVEWSDRVRQGDHG